MEKKKLKLEDDDAKALEIIKAVAQAWQSHSSSSRPTNEFDAHRRNFKGKPSRFKLEAMSKQSHSTENMNVNSNASSPSWDFGQSLWDSYEIVTVSKKLENSLVFDDPFIGLEDSGGRVHKKKHLESKNSLRNLFKRVSSRRFNEANIINSS